MGNKVEELRNTALGHLVKIGRLYYTVILFSPPEKEKGKVCNGCAFRDEGAEVCEYAKACMAHLRPDRNSVEFIKVDRK